MEFNFFSSREENCRIEIDIKSTKKNIMLNVKLKNTRPDLLLKVSHRILDMIAKKTLAPVVIHI